MAHLLPYFLTMNDLEIQFKAVVEQILVRDPGGWQHIHTWLMECYEIKMEIEVAKYEKETSTVH